MGAPAGHHPALHAWISPHDGEAQGNPQGVTDERASDGNGVPRRTPASIAPGQRPTDGMVRIPGGTFLVGSDGHDPQEAPADRVTVEDFWMDRCAVTNAEFRRSGVGAEGLDPPTSAL
jgi:formylglycine-generating enzyme required for sulfatase activity